MFIHAAAESNRLVVTGSALWFNAAEAASKHCDYC